MVKKMFIIAILLFGCAMAQAAVDATTIWEFRPGSGAADNGGGFANLDPGTSVDYSNQSVALTLTDFAMTEVGQPTLTTATGGFTAAMAGNVIYLEDGVNLTDGWYQIVTYTNGNSVELDRDATDGGDMTGGDGKVGGALDIATDAFLEQCVAGNTVYFREDGTAMTLAAAWAVDNDGTALLPITIEGYKTTRGENPTGANRPLIACGANETAIDDYWVYRNLRITQNSNDGLFIGSFNLLENLHVNQSAANEAIKTTNSNRIVNCEIQSAGVGVTANLDSITFCYIHDCAIGIDMTGSTNTIVNNVIETCSTYGIDFGVNDRSSVINNTFYNNATAVYGTDGHANLFINNIFDNNTKGVEWTTPTYTNYFDYNCWDNTDDIVDTDVVWGDNRVEGDPEMTNPAAGDFTLGAGSNCLDAGMQIGTTVGATGDYEVNIGVDQDDVTAAGAVPVVGGGVVR